MKRSVVDGLYRHCFEIGISFFKDDEFGVMCVVVHLMRNFILKIRVYNCSEFVNIGSITSFAGLFVIVIAMVLNLRFLF